MRYFELHCKSNFSFLEGASHADELFQQAAQLGYQGLAITDRNTLAGIVRAHTAARQTGPRLIVGAELHPIDGPPVVAWPQDRAGYGRLCRLISRGRLRREKGGCELSWQDVAELSEGLLVGMLLRQPVRDELPSGATRLRADGDAFPWELQLEQALSHSPGRRTATRSGATESKAAAGRIDLPPVHFPVTDEHQWLNWLALLRQIFGDRAYLLCELHRGPDDREALERLQRLSHRAAVPLVAAGDVHYHVAERALLHDCLLAIRFNSSIDQVASQRLPNAEYHLRSLERMASLFAGCPAALERTVEVAERASFSLDDLRYEYPQELAPPGQTPLHYLKKLTWQGAQQRYPAGVPQRVIELLRHEFQLIEELRYEAYFLTVWDLVRFARQRGILCQGRGSAANSIVCYCLGITAVDPNRLDLLFERFISRERNEAPDIDVDFEHQRREEVLQYIYEKYGRHRAGMTATVISYRSRSALRDCGRALGISQDRIDALSKLVDARMTEGTLADRAATCGIDPQSAIGQRFLYLFENLIGFPRHLSQHVGGMVMTAGWLCELCPLENAAMDGRTVIQWDKNDLDALGILKVDCLSLGMLTAIHRCFDLIDQHHGRPLTLATVPAEDPEVYDMICQADTIGVFQIESRAQMSMLPRLQPRCFYDLVIEVAIVRPGPIQGQMVHPYLQARRSGQQPIYPNAAIGRVLEKTMGVPIFQEQAMRLAVVAAGFTPGEADQLRRAMAAWRRPGLIDQFRKKLTDGMLANGLSLEFADRVFSQIRGFGEYGFPESHAASFALLVYVSCWLKHYYPAAFCASLLNSQPMGFYAPAQLLQDAQSHGVQVDPVDVNFSHWECTLERPPLTDSNRLPAGRSQDDRTSTRATSPPRLREPRLRLGLCMVRGFSQQLAERIAAVRLRDGAFRDLADLTARTRLTSSAVTALAAAGALQSLSGARRAAFWQSLAQERSSATHPLLDACDANADELVPDALGTMDELDEVYADYESTGFSLRAHPLSFIRSQLERMRVTSSLALRAASDGSQLRTAGLVILRQRPSTAKGITFVTLEDEFGTVNLVIKPAIWQRHYKVARLSNAWLVSGTVESREGIVHLLVGHIEDLSRHVDGLNSRSRDFH